MKFADQLGSHQLLGFEQHYLVGGDDAHDGLVNEDEMRDQNLNIVS